MKTLGLLFWLILPFTVTAQEYPNALDDAEGLEKIRSLELTLDISDDLTSVLETENVRGACVRHWKRVDEDTGRLPAESLQNKEHLQDLLWCGKEIFFYSGFETKFGFPEKLVESVERVFESEVGKSFSKLGFIPSPDSKLPIGIAKAEGRPWGALGLFTGPPMTVTCAACHFGKTEDGRYAVGMPNQDLDFGKFNAVLVYTAYVADSEKADTERWPPAIQDYYAKLKDIQDNYRGRGKFLLNASKLIARLKLTERFYNFVGFSNPTLGELNTYLSGTPNRYYASSPIFPLGEKYPEGMMMSSPLMFDLQNYEGDVVNGKAAPVASFIPTDDMDDFIKAAYIFLTGHEKYSSNKYVEPLAVYLRSLKTPQNLNPIDESLALRGEKLFSNNCASCHNGPRGKSIQAYSIEEMGTPEVLLDPFVDYEPPTALSSEVYQSYLNTLGPIQERGGIHARALKGIWTKRDLMVNGAIEDLDHLFCLSKERSVSIDVTDPNSEAIHLDLCSDYSNREKLALKEFLLSWD